MIDLSDERWERIIQIRMQCEAEAMAEAEVDALFYKRLAKQPELYAFFHAEMSKPFEPGEREATEKALARLVAAFRKRLS